MKKRGILIIAKVGIFSALSVILYFIRFPLPPFPSFLKIQFSNLPAVIGGFVMGPFYGFLIVLIRTLISLPFSSSHMVGELADLMIGGAVVVSSSVVYRLMKTKKGGLLSLLVSIVMWVVMGIISNLYVTVPFYMNVFHITSEDFVKILSAVPWAHWFGEITQENFMKIYILSCAIPFNLLISMVVSIITFFVYKRVSNIFHKLDDKLESKEENN